MRGRSISSSMRFANRSPNFEPQRAGSRAPGTTEEQVFKFLAQKAAILEDVQMFIRRLSSQYISIHPLNDLLWSFNVSSVQLYCSGVSSFLPQLPIPSVPIGATTHVEFVRRPELDQGGRTWSGDGSSLGISYYQLWNRCHAGWKIWNICGVYSLYRCDNSCFERLRTFYRTMERNLLQDADVAWQRYRGRGIAAEVSRQS